MGGSKSEEFMVRSDAGEDMVVYCQKCGYAANREVAASAVREGAREAQSAALQEIHTPGVHSIDELCAFLNIKEEQCAKSRIYIFEEKPVLVLMRGNDEVNEAKLTGVLGGVVRPGHPDELKAISGADAGSIGPIGFKSRIIADLRLRQANNLFSGANKNDYHIGGIDLQRDVSQTKYCDLRSVESGEGCVRCGSALDVFRAIELGHIFKLGTRYSEALGVLYLDEHGNEQPVVMGSYGIGCERILACYIEQNHDDQGIIWNKILAPFEIHLLGLNMTKESVAATCEKIYGDLTAAGYEILFDDRLEAQAGFKFNDADLLGMPLQIIVGEKNVKLGKVEIKIRRTQERLTVELGELKGKLEKLL
jgi:prolyl-tRNA synthetase